MQLSAKPKRTGSTRRGKQSFLLRVGSSLGPWDNAMVDEDQARQIYLDDVVNITDISQTLRYCKCHDHKFDQSLLETITGSMRRLRQPFRWSVRHLLSVESRGGSIRKKFVEEMLSFARAEKKSLLISVSQQHEYGMQSMICHIRKSKRRADPDDQKPPRHVGLDHVESEC